MREDFDGYICTGESVEKCVFYLLLIVVNESSELLLAS